MRLYLNHIAELDRLVALEYGRVDDGQPAECRRPVGEHVGYLHDGPDGCELGFKVLGFSELDVDCARSPRSGARRASTSPSWDWPASRPARSSWRRRALFGDRSTVNRELFALAVNASGAEALELWSSCLQAGDGSAHFALRCTPVRAGVPPRGLPPPASLQRDRPARREELVLVRQGGAGARATL